MRKFITIAGAAALLLGSAAPAFAMFPMWQMPSYDVTNKAYIDTEVTAKANTGDNTQKVYGAGVNEMGTGAAYADASAVTFANLFDGCGCLPKGDLYNKAHVDTDVYAKAETGDNYQKVYGGMQMPTLRIDLRHHHEQQPTAKNWMWTGNATAVGSAFTVVNSAYMPE
jgi:hypothetical protein